MKTYRYIFGVLILIVFLMIIRNIDETFYATRTISSLTQTESLSNKLKILFRAQLVREHYGVDCKKLMEWNDDEINNSKQLLKNLANESNYIPLIPDKNFIFNSSMCDLYKQIRGYNDYNITEFEYKFPIAFTILTYENVEQFERLFRAIYRPHNVYCIHVDIKSSIEFYDAIQSIVNCFDNVFIATKLERIVYIGFARLQADINCMRDLVEFNRSHPNLANKNFTTEWKYFLNLASTEFPLKTNYELARILNIYNGANDVEILLNFDRSRIKFIWLVNDTNITNPHIYNSRQLNNKTIPHDFTIAKGSAYCAFSRNFVNYSLYSNYSQDLLEWLNNTYSPDESYWATLQHNIQFNPPGGFPDPKRGSYPSLAKFVGWKGQYKCRGYFRHSICVFSLEDLPHLIVRPQLFANKFLLSSDPITYQCMEEWYYDRLRSNQLINMANYCKRPFVLNYTLLRKCSEFG